VSAHLLFIGGEDQHLRIPFMAALRARAFQVTAAGPGDPKPFAQAGLAFHPLRFERFVNPLADLVAIKSISDLLADARPDLVHSFDTKPNLLVPLAVRRNRALLVVRTINGLGWLYSSKSLAALALRPIFIGLHRYAARWTVTSVFQNRDDQAFFERQRAIGRGRSLVIPGSGVDTERFDQARGNEPALSQTELRKALGLGESEVVVTVSRMTRQKGIPTLLKAAALVHRVRPSVQFLLVGPRESEGRLAVPQAEIDCHAGYVKAIGPRSDIPALLGLADLFAFPTEYREGIPRVLLEAALAQLPIVATKMPGCADVIRDGWNGFLVPPRAPTILAARILDLLGDREKAQEMAARADQTVRRGLGLAPIVTRYAALYTELLDGSHRTQVIASAGACDTSVAAVSS
jgi:glycosyltransferase involved in cell wall biosynthesis